VTTRGEDRRVAGLLEVLRKVFQSIGSVRDEREIFEVVVRDGARRLPYDWLSIVLQAPDPRVARVLLSAPSGAGALRVGEPVRAPSGFSEVLRSGAPFARTNLDAGGPLWEDAGLRDIGVVAYAVVPMKPGERVVGALGYGTRGGVDVVADLDLMARFAHLAASAAVAARQIEDVQQSLTRLREKAVVPVPPDF
jgi:GAF domain-containing protein